MITLFHVIDHDACDAGKEFEFDFCTMECAEDKGFVDEDIDEQEVPDEDVDKWYKCYGCGKKFRP